MLGGDINLYWLRRTLNCFFFCTHLLIRNFGLFFRCENKIFIEGIETIQFGSVQMNDIFLTFRFLAVTYHIIM